MTLEQALLTAVSTTTGCLVYFFGLLWKRSEMCESDRVELRKRIESIEGENGEAQGALKIYERCHASGCPFKPQK